MRVGGDFEVFFDVGVIEFKDGVAGFGEDEGAGAEAVVEDGDEAAFVLACGGEEAGGDGVVVEGFFEGKFFKDELADFSAGFFLVVVELLVGAEGVLGGIGEGRAAVGAAFRFGWGVESADGAGDH